MKNIIKTSILSIGVLSMACQAFAGYTSRGGMRSSGGYSSRSYSRSSYSAPRTSTHTTTVYRNSGIGSNGMLTGMLIGSALSHNTHGGYIHNSGNYHAYATGPAAHGYSVNLCQQDQQLREHVYQVCADQQCINTYCMRR